MLTAKMNIRYHSSRRWVRCRTLSPSHFSLSAHTAWQSASSGPELPLSLLLHLGHICFGDNFCAFLEKVVDRNFFAPITNGVTPLPGRGRIYRKMQEQVWFLAFVFHSSFHPQQNE